MQVSAFLPTRSLKIITIASLLTAALAQTQRIDPTHSSITVYVFKSGFFSGFADNHEIHYRGDAVLKQHDFGITPINIAGGTVKVKDKLKIKFDIVEVIDLAAFKLSTPRLPKRLDFGILDVLFPNSSWSKEFVRSIPQEEA